MVIATDMSTHFQQVKTLKTLLSHQEFSVDKQKGLSYILHSADISHPSKIFPLHQRWTLLLMEEFFRQVRARRGGQCSFMLGVKHRKGSALSFCELPSMRVHVLCYCPSPLSPLPPGRAAPLDKCINTEKQRVWGRKPANAYSTHCLLFSVPPIPVH